MSAALLAAAPATATSSAEPAGRQLAGLDLRETGSGRFRWFGLHVYDARLYAAGGRFSFGQPFALALRYARGIPGERIAAASTDEIARLGFGSPAQRAAWDAAMRQIFPDVKPGSELVGLHVPGEGTRFLHGGRPVGEIADPEFGRAFFAIWLDPRTREPALRASLLGERQ